jgi:hypothetical protein
LSSCLKLTKKYGFQSVGSAVFVLVGKPCIVRDEEIDTIKKMVDPAQANDVSLPVFK